MNKARSLLASAPVIDLATAVDDRFRALPCFTPLFFGNGEISPKTSRRFLEVSFHGDVLLRQQREFASVHRERPRNDFKECCAHGLVRFSVRRAQTVARRLKFFRRVPDPVVASNGDGPPLCASERPFHLCGRRGHSSDSFLERLVCRGELRRRFDAAVYEQARNIGFAYRLRRSADGEKCENNRGFHVEPLKEN